MSCVCIGGCVLCRETAVSCGEEEVEDLDRDDDDGEEVAADEQRDDDGSDRDNQIEDDDEVDDPNAEHMSAHTKSLIAHLASLPGFGQTRARISYVPYTAPEPTGTTLAELQLPWRSSGSPSCLSVGGGATTCETTLSQVNSTSGGSLKVTLKLRNKTVSLDRHRGRIAI